MNKSIEAVVELVHFDGEAPWPTIAEYSDPYMRIFPGLTSEEVGSLVLTACLYNHTEIAPVASETLQAFINRDGFVLPGGLRFLEGGRVKIIPGCCGGLEDWREWLDVPHGKNEVRGLNAQVAGDHTAPLMYDFKPRPHGRIEWN